MKQGWEYVPLSSFAKTSAGGTPLKSNKNYYLNGTVPWLLSGEVGTRDIFESTNFITELGLANSSAKLFPKNTVLVAMYGATAGEAGLLRFEASTNQAVCGIFPSEKHIPEYLYYFFLHFKGELVKQAVGNAQPNISQQKIKNTEIPLPPLEEQKRIVAVLDEAFEGLETAHTNAEENLKNAEELSQSSLHQHLGDVALQQGWDQKTLDEVCKVIGGGTPSKKKARYYGGEIPWATVRDMREELLFSTEHCITKEGLNNSSAKVIPSGEVIIATRVGLGKACLLQQDTAINQDLRGIIPKSGIELNRSYLLYWFRSISSKIIGAGTGATVQGVKLPFIQSLEIPLPPLEEQKRIVDVLDGIKANVSKLSEEYLQHVNDINNLRQSLLQKAFAGELT